MASVPADPRRVVEMPLPIRTYDIDFAGIVSNIVYVRWLEDLRIAMMAEVYPLPQAVAEDVAPVLLETRVTYQHPLTLQDRPVGRIWATSMKGVRWRIAAEIRVGETVHARAEQTGIFIRLSTRRPVPPPAPLVERFAPPPESAP
ncbi:MAG TPA: thioesterase family protein [Stellaceae bacterium]|nr:thioesterase family protein [Stellaceae bacterium]